MTRQTRPRLTDDEIERQLAVAHRIQDEHRRAGLLATGVRYDRAAHRFVLELTNGYLLGIPVGTLSALAGASVAELGSVELISEGALEIASLDLHFSVPGLVRAMSASANGRLGGRATSARKKRASRANGKKGGRPRKASG